MALVRQDVYSIQILKIKKKRKDFMREKVFRLIHFAE